MSYSNWKRENRWDFSNPLRFFKIELVLAS